MRGVSILTFPTSRIAMYNFFSLILMSENIEVDRAHKSCLHDDDASFASILIRECHRTSLKDLEEVVKDLENKIISKECERKKSSCRP
jgi:hypothetical protein